MRTQEWLPMNIVSPALCPTQKFADPYSGGKNAHSRLIFAFSYKMAPFCQVVLGFSSLKPPPTFLTLPGQFLCLPSFVAFASRRACGRHLHSIWSDILEQVYQHSFIVAFQDDTIAN